MDPAVSVARRAWTALGGDPRALDALSFSGGGGFASRFAVDGLAAGAVAAAGLALGDLVGAVGSGVAVDRRSRPDADDRAHRVVAGAPLRWDRPASPLGSAAAAWA